jgi:hypothetical protein
MADPRKQAEVSWTAGWARRVFANAGIRQARASKHYNFVSAPNPGIRGQRYGPIGAKKYF